MTLKDPLSDVTSDGETCVVCKDKPSFFDVKGMIMDAKIKISHVVMACTPINAIIT